MHYMLASDAELVQELSAGRLPKAWTTTTEEVLFLAPLDTVIARGRAKAVFDVDYVWEVYKPEDNRKFGYYTLPIPLGDENCYLL